MPEQHVGLFIDAEYFVYQPLNEGMKTPSPLEVMEIAKKFGRVDIPRAFGDFTEQRLAARQREFELNGISTVHCPTETKSDGSKKKYTDFFLLSSIFETTHTNPNIEVYVLFAGDGHFHRTATLLKHRLNKEVVIIGFKGSINKDYHDSRMIIHTLDLKPLGVLDEPQIDDLIKFMRPSIQAGKLVTVNSTAIHCLINGTDVETRRKAILRLLDEEALFQKDKTMPDGKTIRVLEINYDHPRVIQALGN